MENLTPLDLAKVDFEAGLVELRARARGPGVQHRLRLAECLSLSAIQGAYPEALARIAEARKLDPQNPRHVVREALAHLRFGQTARALESIEALPEASRHGEDVAIVRALAALSEGELKRAKNIASDLADALPMRHAAKFLALDAQMRVAIKGTERKLTELPREPGTEAPWADLLVKLALVRPEDTRAVTQQLDARKVLPKDGPARAAVDEMLALASIELPDLLARVRVAAPGTRIEELLLVRLLAKLSSRPRREALECVRALHEELPDRASIRRIWALMLTQHAVDETSASRFQEALAAVEVCIRLEPHQRMHHQNRAALFTLMSDRDAAEQAWFELERHHYRLALTGVFDAHTVLRPHRMVAQQARISPSLPPRGVFKLDRLPNVPEEASGAGTKHLVVDQSYLDRDPERLRQWMHHRSAELLFWHASLGSKALIEPIDLEEARERALSLRALSESLGVLVRGEGEKLAESLGTAFGKLAERARHRYAKPELDDAQKDLVRAHVETLGDVAVLCLTYNPDPERRAPVDEILRLLRGIAPFFDAELMTEMLRKGHAESPDALPRLDGVLRRLLRVDSPELVVDRAARRKLRGFLAAQLEVAWVAARLGSRAKPSHAETEQLLAILERVAEDAPDDPVVLYWRARVALMGSLLDDVPGYIAAFHRAVKGEHHPLLARVDELEEILAKYKSAGVETRHAVLGKMDDGDARASAERSETELVLELERQPTAIRLYEQLIRKLLIDRRFPEAETWADRAVARCLSAVTQRKARTLHLETLGLGRLGQQSLGALGDDAIRSYAGGTRASAANALEKVAPGAGGYALEFVRGQALLAKGDRRGAHEAFKRALAGCDRGIHMVILRPLAASVDAAAVERLEKLVEPLLAAGDHAGALTQVVRAMSEMDEPQQALTLLASVQHAAALGSVGQASAKKPLLVDPAALPKALAATLSARIGPKSDAMARARALAELAIETSPDTAGAARSILRRLERVESQLALSATLERCHALTESGKLDEALALLAALPSELHAEPRVVRQGALLRLRLGRFDEAEADIARLEGSEHPVAIELRERWPQIRFKHRLAAAQRALRAKDLAGAERLIAGTVAQGDEEELSLGYLLGFHGALVAEALEKEQKLDDAQHALSVALDALDPLRGKARERGRKDLLDLFEQLESRIAILERARKAKS